LVGGPDRQPCARSRIYPPPPSQGLRIWPQYYDPVDRTITGIALERFFFAKTSPNRSFSMSEN
jgi:hypothetical protein